MSEEEIPCPDCSNVMVEWLEGKHPSGEVKRRVRCKQCRRWKWLDD